MIELRYLAAYQQERSQTFDDWETFQLAFASCSTLPDHYSVISLSLDGNDLGYRGQIGNLYQAIPHLKEEAEKRQITHSPFLGDKKTL